MLEKYYEVEGNLSGVKLHQEYESETDAWRLFRVLNRKGNMLTLWEIQTESGKFKDCRIVAEGYPSGAVTLHGNTGKKSSLNRGWCAEGVAEHYRRERLAQARFHCSSWNLRPELYAHVVAPLHW